MVGGHTLMSGIVNFDFIITCELEVLWRVLIILVVEMVLESGWKG